MSNLSVFDFEGYEVRFVGTADKPEWVAQDITAVLGIDRTQVRRLDDYQRGVAIVHTPGGKQEMATVTEPGLYALIFTSRKESAKRFQKWVFEEVLPSIRKTGSYGNVHHNLEWFERLKLYRRHTKIPTGYFSIFEELTTGLMADFEDAGYSLPMGSVPDISVGLRFCQYLREQSIDTNNPSFVRKYLHHYPDGRVVEANIYSVDVLPKYRIWFKDTYRSHYLPQYLKKKDLAALPSLCEILGLPAGSV